MGFGYLFLGYLLFLNPVYSAYTDLFACLIQGIGIWMLARYNRGFSLARCALVPLTAAAALAFLCRILEFCGKAAAFTSAAKTPLALTQYGLEMLYLLFLLSGVQMIAAETSLDKLAARASRWRIFALVYYSALFLTVSALGGSLAGHLLGAAVYLVGLVYPFFIAAILWTCYMRICLEGDEDMPEKPLRFAWANRLRDFSNSLLFRSAKKGKAEKKDAAPSERQKRRSKK